MLDEVPLLTETLESWPVCDAANVGLDVTVVVFNIGKLAVYAVLELFRGVEAEPLSEVDK